jgi:phosphomannomutase
MYTAMHGVGQKFFLRAAHEEGFQNISFVKEQAAPDGSFPTVGFPNPEEEHSLDLAHTEAKKNKISWVFANDPDADRLQVSNLNFSRDFVKLSGNQMGSILGYFAIKKALELGEKPLVASSIVSSRMLKTMALSQGAYYVDALTGFSNIADAALKAQEKTHSKFVFAYEESIGFLVGNVVLDKDGINAGVRFLEIAAWLEREKISVWELLDQLYVRFGLFSNNSWSERFLGIQATSLMSAVMTRVRSLSLDELGSKLGVKYLRKYDLAQAEINSPYAAISANVVIFENENFRLIIRPSGTEPKIKFYIEIIKDVENHNFLSTEKSQSADNLRELRSAIEKILK